MEQKTTIVGTMRKSKGKIPQMLMPAKDKDEHSSCFVFTKDTTMVSYVPKKNKSVILLSTMHSSDEISTLPEEKKPRNHPFL